MSRLSPLTPAEKRLQRHIYQRLLQALDGRSWNWLAQRSGIPQSTLSQQVNGRRFSLSVLVQASETLRVPITYFFPGSDADLEAEAFRRIRAIVEDVPGE